MMKTFLTGNRKSHSRTPQGDVLIEIKNLSHRFADGKLGLDNIDLSIRKAEFLVIAGCNGSGKTTLLKHLNGLLRPTRGCVLLKGVDVSKDLMRSRQAIGMVFQDSDSQIVGETVWEDAAFGPKNLCLDTAAVNQSVGRALDIVGLRHSAEKQCHLLSGGQKRRLAIAGVLAMKPQVLVFDEPFSNLDYPGARKILDQMHRLHKKNHTIIVATHDLDTVIQLATRLIILKDGKIVRKGLPEDIAGDAERFDVKTPLDYLHQRKAETWLP